MQEGVIRKKEEEMQTRMFCDHWKGWNGSFAVGVWMFVRAEGRPRMMQDLRRGMSAQDVTSPAVQTPKSSSAKKSGGWALTLCQRLCSCHLGRKPCGVWDATVQIQWWKNLKCPMRSVVFTPQVQTVRFRLPGGPKLSSLTKKEMTTQSQNTCFIADTCMWTIPNPEF